jgi:hypothetical protein
MRMYTLRPPSPNGDRQDQSTVSGTVAVKRASVLYHRYLCPSPIIAEEMGSKYERQIKECISSVRRIACVKKGEYGTRF